MHRTHAGHGSIWPAEAVEAHASLDAAERASRAREDALREAASSAKPDPSWRIPMDKTEAWAEIVARELCAARMRRNGFSESVIQAVRSLPTSGDDLHDAASVIRFLAPLIAEQCAGIAENPNRAGREWVPGSLWDSIARETAAAIRAAFPKEPK